MNLSRHKWLLYAALGIFLFVVMATLVVWLIGVVAGPKFDNAFDHDACHVIAGELAGDRRPQPGTVSQSRVDAVATQLINASVIGGKITAFGPRAYSGSPFRAVADERGVTCFTESGNDERKAQSVFVPWSSRPNEGAAPDEPAPGKQD